MKLDWTEGVDEQSTGNLVSEDFGINSEDMFKAIRAFYNYSNARGSIVREITSNCEDSHVEAEMIPSMSNDQLISRGHVSEELLQKAKKYYFHQLKRRGYSKEEAKSIVLEETPESKYIDILKTDLSVHLEEWLHEVRTYFVGWTQKDITIKLVDANDFTNSPAQLHFIDYGVGLSPYRIRRIYSKFFSSTKNDTNKEIGAFGLGSKSPFSHVKMFMVRTVYMGIKYVYAVHETKKAPKIQLLSQEETDENNGTSVIINLESDFDKNNFRREIKSQLRYFENIEYVNCDVVEGTIYRGQHFLYKDTTTGADDIHICLGQVYYPIDKSALGISTYSYNVPIALRFEIGELEVVWNREAIKYTEEVKERIREKIQLAKSELQAMYDAKFDTINHISDYIKFRDEKKGDVFELAPGVNLPNAKEIIDMKLLYPKYKGIKVPNDLFYMYEMYKGIESSGRAEKKKKLGSVGKAIEESNRDLYIIEQGDRYSSTRNEYIVDEFSPNGFYIIKKLPDAPRLIDGDEDSEKKWKKFWNTRLTYFQKRFSNTLDDDKFALALELYKEITDYFESEIASFYYSGQFDPSEEWKRKRRQRRAERRRRKREALYESEDIIPIRHLTRNDSNGSYDWKMDHAPVRDLVSFTGIIIFGFQDDDQKLKDLATVFYNQEHLIDTYSEQLKSKRCMFLKIARGNAKILKQAAGSAYVGRLLSDSKKTMRRRKKGAKIKTYLHSSELVIRRYITALGFIENLPEGFELASHKRVAELDPQVHKAAHFVKSYISTYYYRNRETREYYHSRNEKLDDLTPSIVDLFKSHLLYDMDAIEEFKLVKDFLEKYPLLAHINYDLADLDEVKFYMKGKDAEFKRAKLHKLKARRAA